MKFSELKYHEDKLHYMLHFMYADTLDEGEELEIKIEQVDPYSYLVSVDALDDPMAYSIHSKMNIAIGEYSAIVDVYETTGDPLYAVFQYHQPIPFHCEYIHK